MREAQLQQKIVKHLRTLGYIVYKMDPTYQRGVPDLLVLSPGGVSTFLEVKTPTGRVSPIQQHVQSQLRGQGFSTHVIRSLADAVDVLAE